MTFNSTDRCQIINKLQGGSNMTGTGLYKRTHKSVPVIFEQPCNFKEQVRDAYSKFFGAFLNFPCETARDKLEIMPILYSRDYGKPEQLSAEKASLKPRRARDTCAYEMFSREVLCLQNVCSLFRTPRWLIAVF